MKKIFAIVFSLTLVLSVIALGNVTSSAATKLSKPQVGYLKRKSKKVYYRTKNGTKYVAHKTKTGTKYTAHKTKVGTKKAYVKRSQQRKRRIQSRKTRLLTNFFVTFSCIRHTECLS